MTTPASTRLAAEQVVAAYPPPSAGPERAVLFAVLRHVLGWLGAALVARGIMAPGAADAVVADLAQELVGVALLTASAAAAAVRANLSHSRWADAWAVLRGVAEIDHGKDHA